MASTASAQPQASSTPPIPDLLPSGHLPPGRYQTTLKAIEQRFVHNPLDDAGNDLERFQKLSRSLPAG